MTRIFIVRHGQTEWNRVERFRGRLDVPLNEVGLAQAQATAARLAAQKDVVAVYSSPLSRAVRTAEPIAERLGLAVQPLAALDDLHFGEWQGRTPAEVAERYPDLYRRWELAPHTVQFPGGESLAALRNRAFPALLALAERHAGQACVVVSHKVVCKVLLSAALGLDESHYWQIELDNAAISTVESRHGLFVVTQLNDTCHLGGDLPWAR